MPHKSIAAPLRANLDHLDDDDLLTPALVAGLGLFGASQTLANRRAKKVGLPFVRLGRGCFYRARDLKRELARILDGAFDADLAA